MKKMVCCILTMLLLFNLASVFAADWPKWRGPNASGVISDDNWDPNAFNRGPDIVWEKKLGLGYSTVTVRDGRLYTMGNVEKGSEENRVGTDVIYCLDARTGKEIWRYTYPCITDDVWPGSSATPVLDGNRVYTIGDDTGDIYCLNTDNGQVLWKRNVVKEFGALPPYDGVGYAGSALIESDLLLLNINRSGIALNKMTGKTVWASESDRCSFSTPVVFKQDGVRKLANFAAHKLYIQEIATGKILSSYDWDTNANENTADPIIVDDQIFIASAYGKGCILLDIKNGGLEKVWQNMELRSQFTSNVYLDGYIYGIDGERNRRNQLKCVEYKTGKLMWSQPFEFGSLIIADKKLIVLDEKGALFVVEATPDAYHEIARGKVFLRSPAKGKGRNRLRTYWWSNPVLVDGFLYVRSDKGDLLCLDVSK